MGGRVRCPPSPDVKGNSAMTEAENPDKPDLRKTRTLSTPLTIEAREVARMLADVERRAAELRLAYDRLEASVAVAVVDAGASWQRVGELAYRGEGAEGRKARDWAHSSFVAAAEDYERYGILATDEIAPIFGQMFGAAEA